MLEKGFSVPELLHPALPAGASFFPLPSGWYALVFILGAAILLLVFFRIARWRRNLWRRQAVAQLQIKHNADGWLTLIKRILLMTHSRKEISVLRTPEQLLASVPIDEDLRQQLCEKYCQHNSGLDEISNRLLSKQLTRWLHGLPYV